MNYKVGIIGLGYVGLPLAIASARYFKTVGLDLNRERVEAINRGKDVTGEVTEEEFGVVKKNVFFTTNEESLSACNFYIVTVPTPITEAKSPDLSPLKKATHLIGQYLSEGDIVVYESTVFPGCTEEVCVPILESQSSLLYNDTFFCGYSPERINPGDKKHKLTNITKVVSGSNSKTTHTINLFYRKIIDAETYVASSIKIAEAAKVIENTQRDINIAFVNELSMIFEKMGIDTKEVLEVAGTKWNFSKFNPGLVGGHCIGVDPYYLSQKAQECGHFPEMILSGRRINDGMGRYVAHRVMKLLGNQEHSRVLILGFTFKENCNDIRNTKVKDIFFELKSHGVNVDIYDPLADAKEVSDYYKIQLIPSLDLTKEYEALIFAVNHSVFDSLDWDKLREKTKIIFDVKSALPKDLVDGRL